MFLIQIKVKPPHKDKVRSEDGEFKQIFTIQFHLHFKMQKREYIQTGVGQAVSYLHHNDYAGLILPKISKDNYPISDFIVELFNSRDELKNLPICIFDYDTRSQITQENLFLRKKIEKKNDYKIEKRG